MRHMDIDPDMQDFLPRAFVRRQHRRRVRQASVVRGLRTAMVACLGMGAVLGLVQAGTYGLFAAASPNALASVHAATGRSLLEVDPSSIELSQLKAGTSEDGVPIATIHSARNLPIELTLTGSISSILSVSQEGDTVMAQVYTGSPSEDEQLTGTLDVSIGNHFATVVVPISASVLADPTQTCDEGDPSCQESPATP